MFFRKNSKITALVLYTVVLAMPVLAKANGGWTHDLVITNQTSHPLTFKINSVCSEDIGIVPQQFSKSVTQIALKNACGNTPYHCKAIIYKSSNCSGSAIAKAVFDLRFGVTDVDLYATGYDLQGYLLDMTLTEKKQLG